MISLISQNVETKAPRVYRMFSLSPTTSLFLSLRVRVHMHTDIGQRSMSAVLLNFSPLYFLD